MFLDFFVFLFQEKTFGCKMLETSSGKATKAGDAIHGYVNEACTDLDLDSSKPSTPNGLKEKEMESNESEMRRKENILYISTADLDSSVAPQSYELSPVSTPGKDNNNLPDVEMTDSSGYVIHL